MFDDVIDTAPVAAMGEIDAAMEVAREEKATAGAQILRMVTQNLPQDAEMKDRLLQSRLVAKNFGQKELPNVRPATPRRQLPEREFMEDDIIRKRSASQGASTLERARAKARASEKQAQEELENVTMYGEPTDWKKRMAEWKAEEKAAKAAKKAQEAEE
jgi:hypothetical protein